MAHSDSIPRTSSHENAEAQKALVPGTTVLGWAFNSAISVLGHTLITAGKWRNDFAAAVLPRPRPTPVASHLRDMRPIELHTVDARQLTVAAFCDHMRRQTPLLIRGGCGDWAARQRWTHDFFAAEFGSVELEVQDDYFAPLRRRTMAEFIAALKEHACTTGAAIQDASLARGEDVPPYLRYSLPSRSSTWGNLVNCVKIHFGALASIPGTHFTFEVFRRLGADWHMPQFMPQKGYSFPCTMGGLERPNGERFFHDFGVYLSGRGACTRLHLDGSRSHAVLAQVQGTKSGVLLPPCTVGPWFRTMESPPADGKRFAELRRDGSVPPELERLVIPFTLGPGDIVFVPKNWPHEVYTESSSVTLTFNFLWGWGDLIESVWQMLRHGYGGACVMWSQVP